MPQLRQRRRFRALCPSAPAVAALLAVWHTLATAQAPAPAVGRTGTAWDGVYTAAQADRAVEPFNQHCAGCHSLSDSGRSPLSGPEFWAGYAQTGVDDLLSYVASSMPNGRGGSLPAATYNDIVALMLKVNGFPAGTVELSPSSISGVRIVPRDGSSVLPANALARVVGCLARHGSDFVLTHATPPERITRSGVGEDDAARPLGDRTMPLKFVISRLDAHLGARMSASGMLIGPGGAEGLNVMLVERVADRCP